MGFADKSPGEVSEFNEDFEESEKPLSLGTAILEAILHTQGQTPSLVERGTGDSLSIPRPHANSHKTQTNIPMFKRHTQEIFLGYDKNNNERWHTHFYYTESAYYTSEKLRAAYYELAEFARHVKGELVAVTIQLNDEVNKILRTIAANKPASYLADRFSGSGKKQVGHKQPFVIVIEESSKAAPVEINGKSYKRLHAHLLTVCDGTQKKKLKKLCKRLAKLDSSGVKIKTTYEQSVDYDEDKFCWEEEEFGAIPHFPSHTNEYWLNRYRKGNEVRTVLPVDIGWVNYMSKDLCKRFIEGQSKRAQNCANFGLKRQSGIKQVERDTSKRLQDMYGKNTYSTRPLSEDEIEEMVSESGYVETKYKLTILENEPTSGGGREEAGEGVLKIKPVKRPVMTVRDLLAQKNKRVR